jgi:hypothetical protein
MIDKYYICIINYTDMKRKETAKKAPNATAVKASEKPNSKTTLFWEKYPAGVLKIVDMKAVLK